MYRDTFLYRLNSTIMNKHSCSTNMDAATVHTLHAIFSKRENLDYISSK